MVQKILLGLGLDFEPSRRNISQKAGSWEQKLLTLGNLAPWAPALCCARDVPSHLASPESPVSGGDLQVGSIHSQTVDFVLIHLVPYNTR